jgi:hypothetical protein
LDDLKILKEKNLMEIDNVEFSYNLGVDLKIDLEEAK